MSNSSKAVQEIKKLMVQFGFIANEEPTLLSFKLEDDTIVETEKLEKDSKIFKINELFERVTLEDGKYKLKENFEVEVAKGQITSVREIFLDAKLIDGTEIKVSGDALVEGAKVAVVTAEGEIVAPDGVHELSGPEGTKIETKEGLIVKVEEAVKEAEGPEMEKPEIEIEVPMGAEKEMVELVKEFVSKMGEKIRKMEEQMSSLSNEFNTFKKEPAAKKIADGKTEKFNKVDDVLDDKLATIMSLRKSNK